MFQFYSLVSSILSSPSSLSEPSSDAAKIIALGNAEFSILIHIFLILSLILASRTTFSCSRISFWLFLSGWVCSFKNFSFFCFFLFSYLFNFSASYSSNCFFWSNLYCSNLVSPLFLLPFFFSFISFSTFIRSASSSSFLILSLIFFSF